MISVYPLN